MSPLHLPLPAVTSRVAGAALACTAALTLSACTSTGTKTAKLTGESKVVQDRLTRFADLADDENTSEICRDLLTPAFASAIGRGGDCQKGLQAALDSADFTTLNTTSVKFDDPKAPLRADATLTQTVGPKADDEAKRLITLTRASATGKWLIAAVSTTATPAAIATTPKSSAS